MRLSHLVNYDCLLLQVDTQKNGLNDLKKEQNASNKTHNREFALSGTYVTSFPQLSLTLTLFPSNTVIKRNREISEPAHESELRKAYLYLHFVEISIPDHYFSLARF